MIHVNCPQCRRTYELPSDAHGKRATCKKCGRRFTVDSQDGKRGSNANSSDATHKTTDAADRIRQLTELLDKLEEFPQPKLTIGYRLYVLFITCIMLLLPIAYLSIIVGVAWLTWWHASRNHVWTSVPVGRLMIFSGVMYLGLIVAGIVWLISLIKPLFVWQKSESAASGLSREEEPTLFAFVDELADKVGAPRPEFIQLIFGVNAFAAFSTSTSGLKRKEFTLAIGIPLIAGMTLPQLAGVIAHEFGHFRQGGSSLLQRMVRKVNTWFATAARGEDALDAMIENLTETPGRHPVLIILGFAMWILVWLGRGILWLFTYLGVMISASLMRRAEFDADRYEAALVGAPTMEASSVRLVALSLANSVASRELLDSKWGSYLPDDYFAFVAGLADRSRKLQKRAHKNIKKEKPSLLATHPLTRARIEAAHKFNPPGILQSELPATALIPDFQQKCIQLTSILYALHFGSTLMPHTLRPASEAVQAYLNTTEGETQQFATHS